MSFHRQKTGEWSYFCLWQTLLGEQIHPQWVCMLKGLRSSSAYTETPASSWETCCLRQAEIVGEGGDTKLWGTSVKWYTLQVQLEGNALWGLLIASKVFVSTENYICSSWAGKGSVGMRWSQIPHLNRNHEVIWVTPLSNKARQHQWKIPSLLKICLLLHQFLLLTQTILMSSGHIY